jgi:hypothetical protein
MKHSNYHTLCSWLALIEIVVQRMRCYNYQNLQDLFIGVITEITNKQHKNHLQFECTAGRSPAL